MFNSRKKTQWTRAWAPNPARCLKCNAEIPLNTQLKICGACEANAANGAKFFEIPRDKQLESIRKGHDYFSDGNWIVLYTEPQTDSLDGTKIKKGQQTELLALF
jgi:hypothetical protein